MFNLRFVRVEYFRQNNQHFYSFFLLTPSYNSLFTSFEPKLFNHQQINMYFYETSHILNQSNDLFSSIWETSNGISGLGHYDTSITEQRQYTIPNGEEFNLLDKHDPRSGLTILAEKNLRSDESWDSCIDLNIGQKDNQLLSKETNQRKRKSIENKGLFGSIFKNCSIKKSQVSNKNFIKFVVTKFFIEFNQSMISDPNWRQFNKGVENKKSSNRVILDLLLRGHDQYGFKKQNRRFLRQLLRSGTFYKNFLFNSNYIKKKQNLKQYIIGTKIYSIRCCSKELVSRIQTK